MCELEAQFTTRFVDFRHSDRLDGSTGRGDAVDRAEELITVGDEVSRAPKAIGIESCRTALIVPTQGVDIINVMEKETFSPDTGSQYETKSNDTTIKSSDHSSNDGDIISIVSSQKQSQKSQFSDELPHKESSDNNNDEEDIMEVTVPPKKPPPYINLSDGEELNEKSEK
ncbi:unnamed protein product [Lepeophtheirus salmonis]|uniref:(salmon louse) hypothetical protein n=1 Tax=Lepeophtheirus salmonis TaxID=72036 RepID=A0A7R8CFZ2_LEPSM|nr:unnamed protein product [Lepeophtheirus salmonis]CAF2754710.1 unnamed protein product [Lepeophtheirus salmonis]